MRLIDADALLEEHCENCSIDIRNSCATDPVCASAMWLVEAPTVDAVPVVRCKDCKHCYLTGKAPFMYYACDIANGLGAGCKEDDFCSYGERRCDK